MKKLLLLALLVSATVSFAQTPGDMSNSLALSATCSTATATCGATAYSQLMVPSSGFAAALVSVSGTYTGSTFFFEMSTDGDVTWYPVQCARTDISLVESTEALGSSDKKAWACPAQGTTNFRVRQSARSTGSPYVIITLTHNPAPSTNPSVNITQVAGSTVVADPCAVNTKVYVSFNQTGNTQIVTGTAAKKIYPCSFQILTATAQNVALVEGTGSTCGTSTVAVLGFGGPAAATGWNFAANGGIAYGNGGFAVGQEAVNADNICIFQSGAGQVSGGMSYVVQ